jgi:hypothetical protein
MQYQYHIKFPPWFHTHDVKARSFAHAILWEGGSAMPYKYTFIVTTLELQPGIQDLTSEEFVPELAQQFGGMGPSLSQYIQQIPEGPWEAISHSVTRLDRHFVVSLMLRGEDSA